VHTACGYTIAAARSHNSTSHVGDNYCKWHLGLAKRSIRRSALTDEVLEEAWRMLGNTDAESVLLTLYDMAYCEI
jgi:hypothetical protein